MYGPDTPRSENNQQTIMNNHVFFIINAPWSADHFVVFEWDSYSVAFSGGQPDVIAARRSKSGFNDNAPCETLYHLSASLTLKFVRRLRLSRINNRSRHRSLYHRSLDHWSSSVRHWSIVPLTHVVRHWSRKHRITVRHRRSLSSPVASPKGSMSRVISWTRRSSNRRRKS